MQFLKVDVRRVALLLLALGFVVPGVASAQTLKVLDWNTHHGVGTDGEYDLRRIVKWVVHSGAHVVSLNEVEKNNGWGHEDQPARYAALLQAATGKTWYYTFAQRDGNTDGQGNLILSTIPFETTGATTLSYSRSVARAQIIVSGVRVNIFSTHLDADSATRRATQMGELKNWVAGFPQQQIMAGDFNAWPGASEITNMTDAAYDAWAVAKSNGTSVAYDGNSAGNTRNSRIDYIFYSKKATQLVLKSAQVFDTRDSAGVMPSDHRPVMATFHVGSTSSTTAIQPVGGGGRADLMVYRPASGEWLARRSSTGYSYSNTLSLQWGLPGDKPLGADFDGDAVLDIAVFRPSTGEWLVRYSSRGYSYAYDGFQWGLLGDIPLVNDFDGDRRADLGVYRPSTGEWFIRLSSRSYNYAFVSYHWGLPTDQPVPADFDGDGRSDLAVYRPTTGEWFVRFSSSAYSYATAATYAWGGVRGDKPILADFDGDRRADLVIYRPGEGKWYVRYSASAYSHANWTAYQWGLPGDTPLAGDFDGDARTDLAVYRPAKGEWFILYSATGYSSAYGSYQWGLSGDVPIVPPVL